MPTILLLDGARRRLPDEPTWLRRSDWSLRDTATADEALRAVAAHRPALIIVDFEQNPEAALEAVRALRADPAGRDIPLLVLTPPDRAGEVLRAGAGHVFTAEASPEAVLAEVGRLLDLLERAAPRMSVDAPVAFWRDGHPAEGRLTDLSSSGFFTATGDPQPVGARLEVSFRLPHDRTGRIVTGEVIVVRRTDSPESGFGARFFRLPQNASRLIDEFLDPRARRGGSPA
ncbi:MAG: PilZ domain-containing protein [Thermoanaerobaculia bacterium]|nr:PilZ domain-containing protein [Thermoanaerobaculia bacterium]